MKEKNAYLIPATILGVSLIVAVALFSAAWKKSKQEGQTITVTGSAKKEIVSDLGTLRWTLSANGPTGEMAYKNLQGLKPILNQYLQSQGLDVNAVSLISVNTNPNYIYTRGSDGEEGQSRIADYTATNRYSISLADVERVRKLSIDIPSLVEKGVSIQVEPPEYLYTKLSEIKIQIQAEAAKDAMVRAQKIAQATDSKLGTMKNARMGVLQITPKNSNAVSDYGMNDATSIDKEITSVVNASFAIE